MAETIGRYRMCQFVAQTSRMMDNVDGVRDRKMATYITSYYKGTAERVGCEIEAGSFEEAEEIAMTLSTIERSLTSPEFSQLVVMGELLEKVEVDDGCAVTEMVCPRCDRCWIAIYPATLEFLKCPDCMMPCPVK